MIITLVHCPWLKLTPGQVRLKNNAIQNVLALMTGVAQGVGLQVIESITVPDWGLGF